MCQYSGQLRRTGQVPRNAQSTKTEPGKNKNMNKSIKVLKLNQLFSKEHIKVLDQMASQMNSTKHLGKSQHRFQTILFKLSQKLHRGSTVSELVLRRQPHLDTKNRPKYHRKKLRGQYH